VLVRSDTSETGVEGRKDVLIFESATRASASDVDGKETDGTGSRGHELLIAMTACRPAFSDTTRGQGRNA
jgi:hypothetical protein